jgi:hypothetical protein
LFGTGIWCTFRYWSLNFSARFKWNSLRISSYGVLSYTEAQLLFLWYFSDSTSSQKKMMFEDYSLFWPITVFVFSPLLSWTSSEWLSSFWFVLTCHRLRFKDLILLFFWRKIKFLENSAISSSPRCVFGAIFFILKPLSLSLWV